MDHAGAVGKVAHAGVVGGLCWSCEHDGLC